MFALLCITTQAQAYSYIPLVKPGVQIWSETSNPSLGLELQYIYCFCLSLTIKDHKIYCKSYNNRI